MSKNIAETIIGAAVLAAAVGFLIFVVQSTGISSAATGSYPLTARFTSAEGVVPGSDVRLAGVKIGSVTGLSLDPESYLAEVALAVEAGVQIPDDTEAAVASEGLLGGAYIELIPGGSDFMLAEGDEILNTQSAVSLLSLLIRYATGNDPE